MLSQKAEVQNFDQALTACLKALSDPLAPVRPALTETLRASFSNLGRALGTDASKIKPLICTAIMGSDTRQTQSAMQTAAADADLLELRLDALKKIELEKLLPFPVKPVIVTIRKKEEGGHFQGPEPERLAYLQAAIDLGADYIDLEYGIPEPLRADLIDRKKTTGVILSYHDTQATPALKDLLGFWRGMTRIQADYYKIVTTGQSLDDNLTLLHFLKEVTSPGPKIICHAMGPAGLVSRVLAPFFGSQIVYTAPLGGNRTAPGQLETGQMKQLWDILRS
jgi:3-dehydroquinate dehydratase type I